MPEDNKPSYDLSYLCRALNLLPYHSGGFSPSAIIAMHIDSTGAEIELHNGKTIGLTLSQLAELEEAIKLEVNRQTEENRIKQKEAMRENIKMQVEIAAEMQGGIQPGMVIGAPTSRRFRQ